MLKRLKLVIAYLPWIGKNGCAPHEPHLNYQCVTRSRKPARPVNGITTVISQHGRDQHNKHEMDLIARAWRFVGQRHILRCYARRTKREFCNPILEENDLLMRRCDQAGTINRVAATCQTVYPITFC